MRVSSLVAGAMLAVAAAAGTARAGRPVARFVLPTPTPAVTPAPLSDEDVAEFLRAWPAWSDAIASIGAKVPEAKAGADPLEASDAGTAESRAVRDALGKAGLTSERFVDLYRRTAQAWFALQQEDEREETDRALDARIDSLQNVAGHENAAAGAADTLARMKKSRDLQESQESRFPIPPASIDAVKRHRAALAAIFGAAE